MFDRFMRRLAVTMVVVAALIAGFVPTPGIAGPVPIVILGIGDSITEGYGGSVEHAAYRTESARLLKKGCPTQTFLFKGSKPGTAAGIGHEGYPGKTTPYLASVATKAITTYKPDIVLQMTGTNDVDQDHPLETILTNIGNLTKQMKAAGAKYVIVARPISFGPGATSYEMSTMDQVAWRVPAVAAANGGKNVDFHMVKAVDKFHPGDLGYNKVAEEFYKGLFYTGAPGMVGCLHPTVMFPTVKR